MNANDKEVFDGLYAENEQLRSEIARLTAQQEAVIRDALKFRQERDDFRAEIGKLAGACTVLHANNAGLERERDEARATLAQVRLSLAARRAITVPYIGAHPAAQGIVNVVDDLMKLFDTPDPPAPGSER